LNASRAAFFHAYRCPKAGAITYQDALAYLFSLLEGRPPGQPYAPVKLERMRRLVALLGRPDRGFPSVLVAGTKGKGSTAVMLAGIMEAVGLRVGLYTKPHLVDFRERMRINGTLITPDELIPLVAELRQAVERGQDEPGWPPTFFEASAALALAHFARGDVDLAVVEAGIGGRLDACNVVDPLVSIITTIGYDHMEIVGARLSQIAAEDTGVMRPQRVVVTVPQRPVAARVIRDAAARLGAQVVQVGRHVRYRTLASTPAGLRITVRGRQRVYADVPVPLIGRHQALNAAAAIAAAEALADAWPMQSTPFALTDDAVRRALSTLRWPARIEVVHERPTVIVDVAHNPVSFQALRAALDDVFSGRRLILVLGVIGTKDIAGIARVIAPRAAAVIATRPHDPRALAPEQVADAVRRWVPDVRVVDDPVAAVDEALDMARPDDVVCAAGSFHVTGPVRAHLMPQDDPVLDRRTHVP